MKRSFFLLAIATLVAFCSVFVFVLGNYQILRQPDSLAATIRAAINRPTIELGLLEDGKLTIGTNVARNTNSPPHIVKGTSVVPIVTAVEHDGPPPEVELTFGGRVLEPGKPYQPHKRGYSRYEAEVDDTEWSLPRLLIEVTDQPAAQGDSPDPTYRADLEIVAMNVERVDGKIVAFDATVRVWCDNFNFRQIWLTHVSLSLFSDQSPHTLGLGTLSLPVNDSNQSDKARWDANGYWEMQFSADYHDDPLDAYPSGVTMTGAGWNKGKHVRFETALVKTPPEHAESDDVRQE